MFITIFTNENNNFEVGKIYTKDSNDNFITFKKLNDINVFGKNLRYCLIEPLTEVIKIQKTLFQPEKFMVKKIKIIKELSLEELIDLDLCGDWIYNYCINNFETMSTEEKKFMINKIIEKDSIGFYCYLLAENFPDIDLKEMEKIVLERNDCSVCYEFLVNIPNCNKNKLIEKILYTDKFGQYTFYCCCSVENSYLKKYKSKIIKNLKEKDSIGKWTICTIKNNPTLFSLREKQDLIKNVKEKDINNKLQNVITQITLNKNVLA